MESKKIGVSEHDQPLKKQTFWEWKSAIYMGTSAGVSI